MSHFAVLVDLTLRYEVFTGIARLFEQGIQRAVYSQSHSGINIRGWCNKLTSNLMLVVFATCCNESACKTCTVPKFTRDTIYHLQSFLVTLLCTNILSDVVSTLNGSVVRLVGDLSHLHVHSIIYIAAYWILYSEFGLVTCIYLFFDVSDSQFRFLSHEVRGFEFNTVPNSTR